MSEVFTKPERCPQAKLREDGSFFEDRDQRGQEIHNDWLWQKWTKIADELAAAERRYRAQYQ